MTDVLLTVGTRKGLFIGRRRGGAGQQLRAHLPEMTAVRAVALG